MATEYMLAILKAIMKKSGQSYAIRARQLKLDFSILIFYLFSLAFVNKLAAQEYTFPAIKEIFLRERAQTGDLDLREACFGSIDDLIIGTYPPLHSGTKGFYTFMIEKAIQEIKSENVTEDATIWQIYNHGFVVKTQSKTFGFDLKDYFNIKDFLDLADILDAFFISHEHGDHYSTSLINAMKTLDKPVIGPAEWSLVPIKMDSGDTLTIAGLTVIAHYGLHSVPVRQFEVITPEGLKFLHTGDNQTSETLPAVEDIDVMLLNSWINESGATSWIEGVRIAIEKMKPKVTLPGHMMELGHLGSSYPPVPYRDPIASNNGTLDSDYYILAWGERYHYNNTSNDSIPPNAAENLNYSILADTISFSWDLPQAASDGDTASFYRVVINDTEDFLTSNKGYHYTDLTSKLENVKVYSYDDCGNQSLMYSEIQTILEEKIEVSLYYDLTQNYPNPANPSTHISFKVPRLSRVTIIIFDILGREVRNLIDRDFEPGTHTVLWDGLNNSGQSISDGIYFYQMCSEGFVKVRKTLLIK